jgi:hypothetical protein
LLRRHLASQHRSSAIHLDSHRTHLLNLRDAPDPLLDPNPHGRWGLDGWGSEPQFDGCPEVLASSSVAGIHRTAEHPSHLTEATKTSHVSKLIETAGGTKPSGGALKALHSLHRSPRLAHLTRLIAERAHPTNHTPHNLAGVPVVTQVAGVAGNHADVFELSYCLGRACLACSCGCFRSIRMSGKAKKAASGHNDEKQSATHDYLLNYFSNTSNTVPLVQTRLKTNCSAAL